MSERVEAVKEALIEAVVRLGRTRPLATLSVREIAREAGVNHGLVHRHFGSRGGLMEAVAARLSAALHAQDAVQLGMSARTFRRLRARPEIARLVARACLDGPDAVLRAAAPDPARLEAVVAPIRRLIANAPGVDVDPHVLNALAAAAFLGWFAFEPLLSRGFGLPPDADAQLEQLLARLDALVTAADVG